MRGDGDRGKRTGPLSSNVLRSAAWSGWSFMARESRVERKDLAKESSLIFGGGRSSKEVGLQRGCSVSKCGGY